MTDTPTKKRKPRHTYGEKVDVTADDARDAEHIYRRQLEQRAGPDYAGRMRTPERLQRDSIRFGGGHHARGTHGTYDWFFELDPAEQQRIREKWMTPQGFAVDEMEDKLPVKEWLSLTRRIDMASAMARGRHVQRKRYGNLDPYKVVVSGRKSTTRAGADGVQSANRTATGQPT